MIRGIERGGWAWRGACATALLAASCAHPWNKDESERIDGVMKSEPFSPTARGTQPVVLGAEAPPLAAPFPQVQYRAARRNQGRGRFGSSRSRSDGEVLR